MVAFLADVELSCSLSSLVERYPLREKYEYSVTSVFNLARGGYNIMKKNGCCSIQKPNTINKTETNQK